MIFLETEHYGKSYYWFKKNLITYFWNYENLVDFAWSAGIAIIWKISMSFHGKYFSKDLKWVK